MPSFKIIAITADSVFIDADYGDGFNHNNQRVIVGQNIPAYTDNADLQAKLAAYVQMRVDEQTARTAKKATLATAATLVGKTVTLAAAPVVK